jgi:hypothetical protein
LCHLAILLDMQHYKLICCWLCRFDRFAAVSLLARNTADAVGQPDLFDQHRHVSWQSVGRTCQAGTQPVAYFLADGGTGNVVDLNITPNSWAGHENSPVSRGRR